MARKSYGPDFTPLIQALQASADQATRQASLRFDAASKLATQGATLFEQFRRWRREDDEEALLKEAKLETTEGPVSAYALAKLGGGSALAAVQSMVKTEQELSNAAARARNLSLLEHLMFGANADVTELPSRMNAMREQLGGVIQAAVGGAPAAAAPTEESKTAPTPKVEVKEAPTTFGGTMRLGDGAIRARLRLGSGKSRFVSVGDRVGEHTVEAVTPDTLTLQSGADLVDVPLRSAIPGLRL